MEALRKRFEIVESKYQEVIEIAQISATDDKAKKEMRKLSKHFKGIRTDSILFGDFDQATQYQDRQRQPRAY